MKKIILLLFFAAAQMSYTQAQCDKEISTNPVASYNNYPFLQGSYNTWLNSDFNVGELENGQSNVETEPLKTARIIFDYERNH